MKKFLSILLVLSMVIVMCAGALADDVMYIPVMAKGFQHQYWQAVYKGAMDAAEYYGVEIYFDGPASETNIDEQVEMLKGEMAKNPSAIALAALSTDSVVTELQECVDKGIPVIGFDSGVPNAPEGAIYATAATDNEAAAAIAADKMFEQEGFAELLASGTPENPVVIAVISQEAVSGSIVGRTTGFVNRMYDLASEHNVVAISGHDLWKKDAEGAGVIIHVQISATTEATDVATASNAVLNMDGISAIFLSNEGAVTGFLAATADGSELADGGRYEGLIVAGFDAGEAQKNAVRNGWFIGSVTQDPYMIGYYAVELAVKAANGEEVSDIDTGAKWYDASNIDDEMIAMLVYD